VDSLAAALQKYHRDLTEIGMTLNCGDVGKVISATTEATDGFG
jgi:hypothetical protein